MSHIKGAIVLGHPILLYKIGLSQPQRTLNMATFYMQHAFRNGARYRSSLNSQIPIYFSFGYFLIVDIARGIFWVKISFEIINDIFPSNLTNLSSLDT